MSMEKRKKTRELSEEVRHKIVAKHGQSQGNKSISRAEQSVSPIERERRSIFFLSDHWVEASSVPVGFGEGEHGDGWTFGMNHRTKTTVLEHRLMSIVYITGRVVTYKFALYCSHLNIGHGV